jgi:hypothetical protein
MSKKPGQKPVAPLPGVNYAKMDITETWYECKRTIVGRDSTMRVSLAASGGHFGRRQAQNNGCSPPPTAVAASVLNSARQEPAILRTLFERTPLSGIQFRAAAKSRSCGAGTCTRRASVGFSRSQSRIKHVVYRRGRVLFSWRQAVAFAVLSINNLGTIFRRVICRSANQHASERGLH